MENVRQGHICKHSPNNGLVRLKLWVVLHVLLLFTPNFSLHKKAISFQRPNVHLKTHAGAEVHLHFQVLFPCSCSNNSMASWEREPRPSKLL